MHKHYVHGLGLLVAYPKLPAQLSVIMFPFRGQRKWHSTCLPVNFSVLFAKKSNCSYFMLYYLASTIYNNWSVSKKRLGSSVVECLLHVCGLPQVRIQTQYKNVIQKYLMYWFIYHWNTVVVFLKALIQYNSSFSFKVY